MTREQVEDRDRERAKEIVSLLGNFGRRPDVTVMQGRQVFEITQAIAAARAEGRKECELVVESYYSGFESTDDLADQFVADFSRNTGIMWKPGDAEFLREKLANAVHTVKNEIRAEERKRLEQWVLDYNCGCIRSVPDFRKKMTLNFDITEYGRIK